MFLNHRIGAVLLMAGQGSRLGSGIPKQFLMLGPKRVYLHTLALFRDLPIIDEIVLVCEPSWKAVVQQEAPDVTVVEGGATRQESSFLGLQGFTQRPDIVMVHDAVRPFVTKEILLDNINQAILHDAVDTCIPTADTLVYSVDSETIDSIPKRESYLRGQTPQTFRFDCLMEAHQAARSEGQSIAHDDCQLVLKRGVPVRVIRGSDRNFKITTEFDFLLANIIVSSSLVLN